MRDTSMDFEPYLETDDPPRIPLPKGWPKFARVAILHVIAFAPIVVLNIRHWPDGPEYDSLRLRVELAGVESQIYLLKQEVAIKDKHMVIRVVDHVICRVNENSFS